MSRPRPARRRATLACALVATALLAAGCGDDGDDTAARPATTGAAAGADLGAVKTYLLDHTRELVRETGTLRTQAERYHALAAAVDFDHARLLRTRRAEVRALLRDAQATFRRANPAYEQAEGVVAGVPVLADYDVILDAGSDASDPASAVPFSIETPAGRTYKQPGNFFFLLESSLFGTEPRFAAKDVTPDLDGDGTIEFGEALPDADFYVAAARDFEKNAKELDAAAKAWTPAPADAFTAVVVMTPTMSEYFEAWKNSRFIAGDDASEKGFVATSRLADITDILSGLVLVYDSIEPAIGTVDPAQAEQTGRALTDLRDFAAKLRKEEQAGRTFTAEDAETLGGEAQTRAEAVAGQVSQAAGKLGITLED
ncbi:imelysin family protein [Paraconexibacter algicola]|uniref:EfeM/EfeO family lipoprotein n=1 Tax=Paraconexibacter algicola TaxID=2133960 RepID=A0A2T4UMN9_9ACTN|nr:imelysin family protein [Paraconexibacter algicola]PTL60505.1 EfeM/EfeO family lipoprotein [Paraconexibacter algicola]